MNLGVSKLSMGIAGGALVTRGTPTDGVIFNRNL